MAIALLNVVAGLKPKTRPSPGVPSRVGRLSSLRPDDFLWNGCFECWVPIDACVYHAWSRGGVSNLDLTSIIRRFFSLQRRDAVDRPFFLSGVPEQFDHLKH